MQNTYFGKTPARAFSHTTFQLMVGTVPDKSVCHQKPTCGQIVKLVVVQYLFDEGVEVPVVLSLLWICHV